MLKRFLQLAPLLAAGLSRLWQALIETIAADWEFWCYCAKRAVKRQKALRRLRRQKKRTGQVVTRRPARPRRKK